VPFNPRLSLNTFTGPFALRPPGGRVPRQGDEGRSIVPSPFALRPSPFAPPPGHKVARGGHGIAAVSIAVKALVTCVDGNVDVCNSLKWDILARNLWGFGHIPNYLSPYIDRITNLIHSTGCFTTSMSSITNDMDSLTLSDSKSAWG